MAEREQVEPSQHDFGRRFSWANRTLEAIRNLHFRDFMLSQSDLDIIALSIWNLYSFRIIPRVGMDRIWIIFSASSGNEEAKILITIGLGLPDIDERLAAGLSEDLADLLSETSIANENRLLSTVGGGDAINSALVRFGLEFGETSGVIETFQFVYYDCIDDDLGSILNGDWFMGTTGLASVRAHSGSLPFADYSDYQKRVWLSQLLYGAS